MFEKQMERSESMLLCNHLVVFEMLKAIVKELDEMIDDAAERVRKHYKIGDIGDPGTSTDVRPSVSFDHSSWITIHGLG